jgi:hypothetical protein
MRKYPILKELPTTRDYIDTFGGYNHQLRIGANEFYDMKNLSSDNYPVVSTRGKRGLVKKIETEKTTNNNIFDGLEGLFDRRIVAMLSKDSLWYLVCQKNDDESFSLFLMETDAYTMGCKSVTDLGETIYSYDMNRQMVAMGANIIIFPEKICVDTIKGEVKSLETTWKSPLIPNVTTFQHCSFIELCDSEGRQMFVLEYFDSSRTKADDFLSSKTEIKENGEKDADSVLGPVIDNTYYCDSHTGTYYYWHPNSNSWLTQEAFVKIGESRTNFDEYFNVGDAVKISGITENSYRNSEDIKALTEVFDNNLDEAFIVLKFIKTNSGYTEMMLNYHPIKPADYWYDLYSELTIQKRVPEMDFVIENNNRLWGCRYGENRDGEFVNEIYASALGDCTNWECFAGTSQDSWVVSLGSDGAFTGAISYLGNPVFFKNDCIHTIQGSYPATYQLQTTECKGVQNGCEKSLILIDGVVYYKSIYGVCAYTGSMPVEIGRQLNEKTLVYTEAIAGEFQKKYYMAVKDTSKNIGDNRVVFVYDTDKGLWHKEDDICLRDFCSVQTVYGEYLYYSSVDNEDIHQINGTDFTENENCVPWFAETGIITCSTPDKKYISKMSFRMSMDVGTRVYVYIEYDSSGVWEQIASITGAKIGTFTFPIKPKRCDHFRLKLEGTDSAKIYSISKTIEQGSDR